MKEFKLESTLEIINYLENSLLTNNELSIKVLDPDINISAYSGENISGYIYRSLKNWVDLAQCLKCKLKTPIKNYDNTILLTFIKLNNNNSFHDDENSSEKYGEKSIFFKIQKTQEPSFIYYYKQALKNVMCENRQKILNLGINRGDEFEVIKDLFCIKNKELVGVDFCHSAIMYAKNSFKENSFTFLEDDINNLNKNIGKFDLIISIGTLQSSSLNYKLILMDLIQNFLSVNGAIILGFPNSRWIDKELVYGAKAPNYSFNEMSLLIKDLYFAKKYLQQKKFRVTITGKDYIFLTATKIGSL